MVTSIEIDEIKARLSAYVGRAARTGERILVMRHGEAVAALVSVEDLRRLEELGTPGAPTQGESKAARQAKFRRAMAEAGLLVHWPSGDSISVSEYQPLDVDPPLSEQIIADRR